MVNLVDVKTESVYEFRTCRTFVLLALSTGLEHLPVSRTVSDTSVSLAFIQAWKCLLIDDTHIIVSKHDDFIRTLAETPCRMVDRVVEKTILVAVNNEVALSLDDCALRECPSLLRSAALPHENALEVDILVCCIVKLDPVKVICL